MVRSAKAEMRKDLMATIVIDFDVFEVRQGEVPN
jgi:hypothetical protein